VRVCDRKQKLEYKINQHPGQLRKWDDSLSGVCVCVCVSFVGNEVTKFAKKEKDTHFSGKMIRLEKVSLLLKGLLRTRREFRSRE